MESRRHQDRPDPANQWIQERGASADSSVGEDVFEWMPGGFFRVHHWKAAMGKLVFAGSDIVGFDRDRARSFSHFFEEFGSRLVCRKNIERDAATSGRSSGSSTVVRSAQDQGSLSIAWEWRIDEDDRSGIAEAMAH